MWASSLSSEESAGVVLPKNAQNKNKNRKIQNHIKMLHVSASYTFLILLLLPLPNLFGEDELPVVELGISRGGLKVVFGLVPVSFGPPEFNSGPGLAVLLLCPLAPSAFKTTAAAPSGT